MALNISRSLCRLQLRSILCSRVSARPCCCYILTESEIKHNRTVTTYPTVRKNTSFINEAIRHFSTNQKGIDKKSDDDHDRKNEKLSLFKRFKQMYRDYWYVLVPVHLVTSAAWFGGFYYLAVSGVDVPALLEYMNFNERIVNSMRNSSMGYFAITYALYKLATPVRYAVTLGGTTVSIQYLKQLGYIRPMPSKERLKEIYAETREGMKEKRENIMESVQHLKSTVKETKEGLKDTKNKVVSSVAGSKECIRKKVISTTGPKRANKPFNKS